MVLKKIIPFLCVATLVSGNLFAGTDKKVEADLAELHRIIDAQSKNLATAMSQVQEMVSEFQKITGQVDQGVHGNEQQTKIVTDNQRRLDVLEDKMQHLVTQLEEIKSTGLVSAGQVKDLNDFKAYEAGIAKVNASDYKGAVSTLQAFITANPKSRFIDSAQYWIGESYFQMRDFPKSVSEFQKVIKDYPKSNKVGLAMLKQGFAFFEMQSLDDAKAFLGKVVLKYPTATEGTKAKEKINEINAIQEAKAVQAVEKKAIM